MIDGCKKLHWTENLSFLSHSAFCTSTAATHHAAVMCRISGWEEATNFAWRLPIHWLGSWPRGVCAKLANLPSKTHITTKTIGPIGSGRMIILLPALGIRTKINMLEVRKTICYQAIPYHLYWFGLAMPQLLAYGEQICTWSTNLYQPMEWSNPRINCVCRKHKNLAKPVTKQLKSL